MYIQRKQHALQHAENENECALFIREAETGFEDVKWISEDEIDNDMTELENCDTKHEESGTTVIENVSQW